MIAMTKNIRFVLLIMLLAPGLSRAQKSGEENAVREVITRLFTGMEKGDSAMVHSVFTEQVTLAAVFRDKNKNPVLRRESSVEDFLKAVGTPHKEVWHEETWNLKIQIDDDLAQAWCDYAFYIDNTFSHCGVDAFQLHKGKDGWKIFHLADTRRKEGCEIPKTIKNKHQ
jgi:hypothetical protein